MNRIERETQVITLMITHYCRRHGHSLSGLCPACGDLLRYASQRLAHCPKGECKTSCRKCEIHCYAPVYRERIRAVMRYMGPRMLLIDPGAALRHMISELR